MQWGDPDGKRSLGMARDKLPPEFTVKMTPALPFELLPDRVNVVDLVMREERGVVTGFVYRKVNGADVPLSVREAVEAANPGLERLSRLASQLLSLARNEPEAASSVRLARLSAR